MDFRYTINNPGLSSPKKLFQFDWKLSKQIPLFSVIPMSELSNKPDDKLDDITVINIFLEINKLFIREEGELSINVSSERRNSLNQFINEFKKNGNMYILVIKNHKKLQFIKVWNQHIDACQDIDTLLRGIALRCQEDITKLSNDDKSDIVLVMG